MMTRSDRDSVMVPIREAFTLSAQAFTSEAWYAAGSSASLQRNRTAILLVCELPDGFDAMRLMMATTFGGKHWFEEVLSRHRVRFATQVRRSTANVFTTGKTVAETVPAAFDKAVADVGANGLDQPILHMVNDHSRPCARVLEAPAG